ncbi:hypothetical protein WA1_49185 [Scytonema hofmannii PCC 7110]|uniref:Uncharacterized protein n=1 Tax=Scytonema hofmannii PCC 7110 TaxID=128403 RepID=A0A139WQK0_9CYAN|nr:hypothetical protein [Scytonema hofmannii]KYC34717.1 hypothetical protein WA1_49185 [Scytonema hofmannii PCC 7110]
MDINDTQQTSALTIIPANTANDAATQKPRAATNRKAKTDTLKYLMALGLGVGLFLHGLLHSSPSHFGFIVGDQKAVAATLPKASPLPTKLMNGIPIPDWSKITFKNMKFSSPGSVQFPNIKNPGMKELRSWVEGQGLDEVMELGDFEATEFGIENLSLKQISQITGIKLNKITLDKFELTDWQTVGDLMKAIPKLGDQLVENVPPINDLIAAATGSTVTGQTVSDALSSFPELKNVELGSIDLSKYKLTDIPGIENSPIKDFHNWQNNTINNVPGLSNVPFSEFPGVPVPDFSFVGKVDLPLREVEANRWKSISGSYQEGFNVPCTKDCAHIELALSSTLTGAQWMSGKFQKVKGGFGILGKLNGGKEPTGRHPFGKAFKQAVWEINEADGSITTSLFFRICKRGFPDLGCSPYFIGPVPFFTYREMDPIILGAPVKVPTKP